MSLPEGCGNESGAGGIEILAQGLDELDQVFFILFEVRGVAHVLVALPPEESGDFVILGARVVVVEILKRLLGGGHVAIVLATGIPSFGHVASGVTIGLVRSAAVTGLCFSAMLVRLASGRQQVPAKTAVADAALEDQDRRVGDMANMVANPNFRTDVATDGHPLILMILGRRITGAHDKHVADVPAHRPLIGIVDQVGVFFRGDPLQLARLSKTNHVRLSQQDIDLDRLAHVRLFAVGIRQFVRQFLHLGGLSRGPVAVLLQPRNVIGGELLLLEGYPLVVGQDHADLSARGVVGLQFAFKGLHSVRAGPRPGVETGGKQDKNSRDSWGDQSILKWIHGHYERSGSKPGIS